MNQFGAPDILIATRSALLDALEALADQRSALVLIGAQAIYLHTGDAPVALARERLVNPHEGRFADLIRATGAAELRLNFRIEDLGGGYSGIVPLRATRDMDG
jgi:hypothetical protein